VELGVFYFCLFADVRTQAMYQMMDQGFVGLIFSCFIEDKNTKGGQGRFQ